MIIARSPLRISLGGGGTDLPSYYREHEGFLIAAAIDNPEVGAHLSDRLGASPDVLDERLQSALAAGQLKPGTPAEMLVDAFIGVIFSRVLLRTPPRSGEARTFVDLILGGAAAR